MLFYCKKDHLLNIHHILEHSSVNGPGVRAVIWTQGCPLRCQDCFNPKTHSTTGGTSYDTSELAKIINGIKKIRGLSISGGEPLIQTEALIDFLEQLNPSLDILLFSGFTLKEIEADKTKKQILEHIDAGLFGRYNHQLSHPFMGKKLVLRGNRIKADELEPYFSTELIIHKNNITITGLFKKGA